MKRWMWAIRSRRRGSFVNGDCGHVGQGRTQAVEAPLGNKLGSGTICLQGVVEVAMVEMRRNELLRCLRDEGEVGDHVGLRPGGVKGR